MEVNGIKYEYYKHNEDMDSLIEVYDVDDYDDDNCDEEEETSVINDGDNYSEHTNDNCPADNISHEILNDVRNEMEQSSNNSQEFESSQSAIKLGLQTDNSEVKNDTSTLSPSKIKSFSNKMDDIKLKLDKKQFTCDTCGEIFDVFSEFNSHKRSHGQFRYQCKICQKWFSKRYYLKMHENLHLGFKSHKCNVCGKVYTSQGNLDRHIRVSHKNDRRYKCDKCDKAFSQLTILRQHQAVHTTERKYSCDICIKSFKTPEYLALHKARHLPKAERPKRIQYRPKRKKYKPVYKPCVCTECGKTSANTTLHLSHMK